MTMAMAGRMDSGLTEQRLAALEFRYRRTLDGLTAANASYASICNVAQTDELEARRALARVQHLQGQAADLQTAMEVLEDKIIA
jgi:hypothetical protein